MSAPLAAARRLDDRITGVLVGAAVGDALGVPYELVDPPLTWPNRPQMLGGGLGDYAPGEYSDDTQMAWCIARVLADGLDLRTDAGLDSVASRFLQWRRDATDIGTQTAAVLDATERAARFGGYGYGYRMRHAAAELHRRTGRTAGNGSLMRTAPVALAYLDDVTAMADAARRVSDLTHHDPVAGDACVIWCAAIRWGVLQGTVGGIYDGVALIPEERRSQWRQWIEQATTQAAGTFNPNGYVVPALQAAWSAVSRSSTYAGTVTAAVRAGHDTDTVACIAGALAGAVYGRSAIPQKWRRDVMGWPMMDANTLAELAAQIAAQPRGNQ